MRLRAREQLMWVLAVSFAALFIFSVTRLGNISRPLASEEMQVALPRFVQVVMAAGDRYLAANLASFRATVASTESMRPDNFRVQGVVQRDAAWLNPFHEDNYYVAAAILPWHGELDAAQDVLSSAMRARPFDWQPAFYFAFNLYFIRQDAIGAADVLLEAATKVSSERSRGMMEGLAYAWYEKGYSPEVALELMEASAKTARSGALRRYLIARSERLRTLLTLQEATAAFRARFGRPPLSIEELVTGKFVAAFPVDPLGVGFELDPDGKPVIKGNNTKRGP